MTRIFDLGKVVCTPSMMLRLQQDGKFRTFVHTSLGRYVLGDWGDTCKKEAQMNDQAVVEGERILAVYTYPADGTRIWIITEWDRCATTILFPGEY